MSGVLLAIATAVLALGVSGFSPTGIDKTGGMSLVIAIFIGFGGAVVAAAIWAGLNLGVWLGVWAGRSTQSRFSSE